MELTSIKAKTNTCREGEGQRPSASTGRGSSPRNAAVGGGGAAVNSSPVIRPKGGPSPPCRGPPCGGAARARRLEVVASWRILAGRFRARGPGSAAIRTDAPDRSTASCRSRRRRWWGAARACPSRPSTRWADSWPGQHSPCRPRPRRRPRRDRREIVVNTIPPYPTQRGPRHPAGASFTPRTTAMTPPPSDAPRTAGLTLL